MPTEFTDFCQVRTGFPFAKILRQISRIRQVIGDEWLSASSTSRWKRKSLFGLIYFVLGSLTLHAVTSMSEYQLKALFLINFVKYVNWPEDALPDATAPFIIGLMGQKELDYDLKAAIEGKKINGREIIIKHLTEDENLSGCEVLFIDSSENPRLSEILSKARTLPILTVGENETFLQKGGIINFILRDGKIHLEINLLVAQRVNLQISSKLLSVAETVKN